MTSEDLRRSLKDPLVLNFVMAVFAVERIYSLIGSKFTPTYHFWCLLMFIAGFLAALRDDENGLHRKVSYYLLFGGLILGCYSIAGDIVTVQLNDGCRQPQEIGRFFYVPVDFLKMTFGIDVCD